MLRFPWVFCLMLAGCAPSLSQLDPPLDSGDYEKAVALTQGDPEKQIALAVRILERTAQSGMRTSELEEALARAGKPGAQALKRLAKNAADPAGRLAAVLLRRNRSPRKSDLKKTLGDESSDVRAAAAGAWVKQIDTDTLKKLLMDVDPRVRRVAVVGLGRRTSSENIQALLRDTLRRDPDAHVRAEAAKSGGALGPNFLFVLKLALADENLGVRLAALAGLVKTEDETALIIVREYAAAPSDEMTVAAAAELARTGDPWGLERLLENLESRRPGIRAAALLRLERGNVKKSEEIVLSMIGDTSPLVVYQAAALLSKHRKHRPAVTEALKKIELEHASQGEKARDLLATMGDKEALSSVSAALKQDNKTGILQTLSRVSRTKTLQSEFASLMANPDQEIRIAAAKAVLTADQ